MNKVVIHRINEFNNKNRKIKLFVDNAFYKTIDDNSRITISTKKDEIKLKAKIDWCTSKNFRVDFRLQSPKINCI